MKPSPQVSVVMAVHNGDEELLRESIRSILCQEFRDFEFIIVDDINPEVVVRYLQSVVATDARVRLLRNRRNMGLTRSLISAIPQGRGKYIARQDADDVSSPERLSLQVQRMEREEDVVLLGCWFEVIHRYRGGERTETKRPPDDDRVLRNLMFMTNPFCHASVMFRESAYKGVKGYDGRYATSQDLDLWMKLAGIGKVAVVERCLVTRIIHSRALSVSLRKHLIQVGNGVRIRLAHRHLLGNRAAGFLAVFSALYQAVVWFFPRSFQGRIFGVFKKF